MRGIKPNPLPAPVAPGLPSCTPVPQPSATNSWSCTTDSGPCSVLLVSRYWALGENVTSWEGPSGRLPARITLPCCKCLRTRPAAGRSCHVLTGLRMACRLPRAGLPAAGPLRGREVPVCRGFGDSAGTDRASARPRTARGGENGHRKPRRPQSSLRTSSHKSPSFLTATCRARDIHATHTTPKAAKEKPR